MINTDNDRIVHLKGNPREIGFKAGCMLGDRLEQMVNQYIAEQPYPKDMNKLHSGALPWLYSLPKRFQDEYEGLAEGAKISLQRLVELTYIEECDVVQCSGVIYPFENKVWVARNNDTFVPDLWGYLSIKEVKDRIPTINFSLECDVFTPTGINKEKLWLHYNFLPVWDRPSLNKPHFPGYVFLTDALELCHNINDLEKMLNEVDRDGGMLLFAVDGKTNEFALFECLCSKYYKREPANEWMVGTNHFCSCEDPTLTDADKEPLGTLSRFSRLEDLVDSLSTLQSSPSLPADLIRILADDQIERRGKQIVTAYSNVVCPSTGEIWYTFGGYPSASNGNWKKVEWPWMD
jgi:hypothetical protein